MKTVVEHYDIPADCFASQIDSRTVGIFNKNKYAGNACLQRYTIPHYIDCRQWHWFVTHDGKIELSYTIKDCVNDWTGKIESDCQCLCHHGGFGEEGICKQPCTDCNCPN